MSVRAMGGGPLDESRVDEGGASVPNGVGARGSSHARAGSGGAGRTVLDVDVLIEELLSVSPVTGELNTLFTVCVVCVGVCCIFFFNDLLTVIVCFRAGLSN